MKEILKKKIVWFTLSLKFPWDRGLATRSKSVKRNRCLGLAFNGKWGGDMAHGASTRNFLLQGPLLFSNVVKSVVDFLRNDLFFCKKTIETRKKLNEKYRKISIKILL